MSLKPYFGQVLVVDDDELFLELLTTRLEETGFRVHSAKSLEEMRARVSERPYQAILLDLFIGEENALEALPLLVRERPEARIIVMSASGTIELAVDALERGASTFVSKAKDIEELVKGLVAKLPLGSAATAPPPSANYGIIGDSEGLRSVLVLIDKVKDVDSVVLIEGESGTGKELVARAIHDASARGKQPFEAVNCGAIPENLLESELFGHARGAFTGAKDDRKGLFEVCSSGTLFLDEIGELPLSLQVKLLRVLQEREVRPLGGRGTIQVETRVVAATNKNLAKLVEEGKFREDLYYRLCVLRVTLPPLRDRRADIPQLLDHFLTTFNRRFGKNVLPPGREAVARLLAHSWPGNIRELKNAVERGVVLSTGGEISLAEMMPDHMAPPSSGTAVIDTQGNSVPEYLNQPLSEAKRQFEEAYLRHLLSATRGNISEMARLSGRYRADIYRLLEKHGVQWEEFRPS